MFLLNKIGFYQTLRLLSSINGEVKLKHFYAKFMQCKFDTNPERQQAIN